MGVWGEGVILGTALTNLGAPCWDPDAIGTDGICISDVRVAGGTADNNWLMQFVTDETQQGCVRSRFRETTAFGVIMLTTAGFEQGFLIDVIFERWKLAERFRSKCPEKSCLLTGVIL